MKKSTNIPLLTIITLTKNSSKYISKSMISLKNAISNCDSEKISHLVIDGNSNDNTVEIISKILPQSPIIKIDPKGIYNAINYALINHVKSNYVTYLHSDDMYDEQYLKYMILEIEKNRNTESVYVGTVLFINSNSEPLYKRFPPFFSNFFQKFNNLILHPNAVYPTKIEREFLYDENIGRIADYDHINKIMTKLKQIRIKKAIYKFRISQSSITFTEGRKEVKQHYLFSRIYIHLFETQLLKRLIMKLRNNSYWR